MPFGRSAGLSASMALFLSAGLAWAQNASGVVAQPAGPSAVATTPADPLLDQVERAIEINSHRYLRANYNSPWQIFHGIVAYRRQFMLQVGDQRMPAIDWIATADARFHNLPWILITQHGAKFHPYSGVPKAFEGHPSQSLALLSESHLPTDFKFKVSGREVTIAQMLNNSMMEVNTREETTWVLWALINYMPVDKQWVNQWGEPWSIERLVQIEVAADTPNRPCGGNHNLFVLCRARDKFLKSGQPLRGVWLEADQKIRTYTEYARSMQNRDGSFSSNFYKGPGHTTDMNSRFNTTGHTLEFLSVALPDQRLSEMWVRNAVNILSWELIQAKSASPDPGPLYHSLNALINYRDRVQPKPAAPEVAQTPEPSPAPTSVKSPPAESPAPQTATAASTTPGLLAPTAIQVAKPVATVAAPVIRPQAATDPTAPTLVLPAIGPETSGPVSALEPANRW
uniref:Uncharacterized protein n=1 Tax=Schlesneria paludicola TaxID=360056 RepID=A0A7C2P5G0_9PLAN